MYKPLVPVSTKSYYSPAYSTPKSENSGPDLRSTIYWNPEVLTDDNGEAIISFYTSDKPGNYLIILQGMDYLGRLGFISQYLQINE